MNSYRRYFKIWPILFLLLITLSGCGNSVRRAERAIGNLVRQIERGNLSEITLIIYGAPTVLTPFPVSVDELINGFYLYRIVVDGVQLEEYIDLLMNLVDVELIPVVERSRIDARLYYVFEDRNGHRIFDFAMWGTGDSFSVFVNGVEVEDNPILLEIIMPFLPGYPGQ